jgi:hypothetical protein
MRPPRRPVGGWSNIHGPGHERSPHGGRCVLPSPPRARGDCGHSRGEHDASDDGISPGASLAPRWPGRINSWTQPARPPVRGRHIINPPASRPCVPRPKLRYQRESRSATRIPARRADTRCIRRNSSRMLIPIAWRATWASRCPQPSSRARGAATCRRNGGSTPCCRAPSCMSTARRSRATTS